MRHGQTHMGQMMRTDTHGTYDVGRHAWDKWRGQTHMRQKKMR